MPAADRGLRAGRVHHHGLHRIPGAYKVPAADDDDDHYRFLYRHLNPVPLVASEHTGQLASVEAADVQQQFLRGEINALSCSTTFELGVDVGELQSVVLRNMPPTTANYVQRAGRAGRRTDSAALVVTYAQRRSHDLSRYQDPSAWWPVKCVPRTCRWPTSASTGGTLIPSPWPLSSGTPSS